MAAARRALWTVTMLGALSAFQILATTNPVAAQAAGANIRIIAGNPAGSATDMFGRIMGDHMAKTLGQTILVENRLGGSRIVPGYVGNQPADGRTILVGTQAMMEIWPIINKKINWSVDDFVPLVKGIESPLVLVTNPKVPAKTLDELIAWIKANPGKLSYASYAPGTPSHFLGYLLNEKFSLDLVHVPYLGSGPQVKDISAGHIPFGFAQIAVARSLIESGRLNAIATTGAKRFQALPNVPSVAELGHPELEANIWFGLFIRKDTPKAEQDRLVKAAFLARADPEVRKKLEQQGFEVSDDDNAALTAGIKKGQARWSKIVKATGFKRN